MLSVKELTVERLKCSKEEKVKRTSLGSLISEAKSRAKSENREVLESDLVKVSKSTIKKLEKQIEVVTGQVKEAYLEEINILRKLLPRETSEDEINSFIDDYISEFGPLSNKLIGDIMKRMKSLYGDKLNAGTASKLIKNRI